MNKWQQEAHRRYLEFKALSPEEQAARLEAAQREYEEQRKRDRAKLFGDRASGADSGAASDRTAKTSGFGIGELGGVPETTPAAEAEAAAIERQQYTDTDTLVRCSCGHTVHRSLVMSASRGTACPDCYDRMSD